MSSIVLQSSSGIYICFLCGWDAGGVTKCAVETARQLTPALRAIPLTRKTKSDIAR